MWPLEADKLVELCYNVQYMDKNNRNRGDPWSLRQWGIYQQCILSNHRTMWIIVQPPPDICDHIYQILDQNAANAQSSETCAAHIHLAFIALMARNWQEYLEYLQSELAFFVRRPVLLNPIENDSG